MSCRKTSKTDRNKADENLAWEEISTEHIVQDRWIDFRKSAYRYPDGRVFEPFYSYSRRDYVVIVASDTEGNYICVRQFRQAASSGMTAENTGPLRRRKRPSIRRSGS